MSNFDTLTTRMPNGVNNCSPWQTMGASGTPDPTFAVQYESDFLQPTDVSNLTLTNVTGTGTFAATTGQNGLANLITATAGATDRSVVGLASLAFALVPGKATFYKFAGKLDSILGTVEFGFGAFTGAAVTNGVTIKAVGGVLSLNVYVAGTLVSTTPFPTACALVSGTPFEVGLMVDWQQNVAGFFNPTTGGTANGASQVTANNVANGNQPRGRVAAAYYELNGALTGLTLPTAQMNPFFSLTNTTAVARTLTADFMVASLER